MKILQNTLQNYKTVSQSLYDAEKCLHIINSELSTLSTSRLFNYLAVDKCSWAMLRKFQAEKNFQQNIRPKIL